MNKNLLKPFITAVSMLAFAITGYPQASQVPGPVFSSVITITTNYYLPGITTTNIPTSAANLIPIGKNGVGFFLRMGGTNATTTTNATILLEQNLDGSNWVDSHTFTLSVPQNGTTGYDYYTNFLPTTANLLNARWLRVKSIQNTNVQSVWITNFYWSVRE